jgi:radical SAM protein with 4Fe4S-binding SPASM domain
VNSDDQMDVSFVEFVRNAMVEINPNITITFWGGEPSINMKSIDYVISELRGTVKFAVYHNGFSSDLTDYILANTTPDDWEFVQISYDGRVIQDVHRLTHDGSPTSEYVLKHFDMLHRSDFPVSLKSTLPVSDIDKMYDVWCEFDELSKKYSNISYFPSIDGEYTTEVYDAFKEQAALISHAEYLRHQERGELLCSWYYRDNDPKCGHGIGYITVGVDGRILPCHGVLYYDIPELIIGNIENDSAFDDIREFKVKLDDYMNRRDSKCTGCVSLVCNVCNIYAYANSEKDDMIDRLVDRCSNKWCSIYKIFGVYGRILLDELKKAGEDNGTM